MKISRPEKPEPGSVTSEPTAEVGSEGGGSGDVEVVVDREPATGSEADETWRPGERPRTTVVQHDETGRGRRSP
jgi:hypothetical protein